LAAKRTIEDDWIASRCGWKPFAGRSEPGWPKVTVIRGRRVMWEDEILGTPGGGPVRFLEALLV
ncbi:MAG: dihydroorotase, partial [Gammaproteobacteria bacterium]